MWISIHVQTLKDLISHFRVLLRVRMLYYLKQEVIGEHADSVLKGADIRYLIQPSSQVYTHKLMSQYTSEDTDLHNAFPGLLS